MILLTVQVTKQMRKLTNALDSIMENFTYNLLMINRVKTHIMSIKTKLRQALEQWTEYDGGWKKEISYRGEQLKLKLAATHKYWRTLRSS